MTKLLEQNEPFAWACWSDGDTEQKPIDCYLSTDEPTAYPIRKKLFTHPAPSAPEGWQQFSHTLKYLIGTWRDGKGMFPQESDKYDESIAAAHLLLKEADWQQGRYFPILAAARNEKKLQESAPTETYIHEHTKLPHPGYFGIPKGYWQWALQYHQAMLIEEAKTTPQYPRNDLSAGGLNQIIADRNQP